MRPRAAETTAPCSWCSVRRRAAGAAEEVDTAKNLLADAADAGDLTGAMKLHGGMGYAILRTTWSVTGVKAG